MYCSFRVVGFIAASSLALTSFCAQADVSLQESLSVEGGGLMGMAAMNGTSTTYIAGSRGRTESDIKMKSSVMRLFGGGPTGEITRLDDDKVYELNLKKKTYVESSLSERRAKMQEAMAQAEKDRDSKQQAASPVDTSKCDWTPPKSDLKKTGEKASIAGFDTERSTLTVTQTCKNRETGTACDFTLLFDQWTSKNFEAGSEREAFYKLYADKLGLGPSLSPGFAQSAQSLFSGYKDLWAEVAKQGKAIKGYPLRSSFALAIGGAQCQSAQGNANGSGAPTQDALAAASQLGSALGGMFGKKPAAASESAPARPALLVNGLPPLIAVSTELLSVSRDALPASLFEPPAGFKKVKAE